MPAAAAPCPFETGEGIKLPTEFSFAGERVDTSRFLERTDTGGLLVLQMSSGARWNEDYGDPESDINQFSRAMAGLGAFDEFLATMVRDTQ